MIRRFAARSRVGFIGSLKNNVRRAHASARIRSILRARALRDEV